MPVPYKNRAPRRIKAFLSRFLDQRDVFQSRFLDKRTVPEQARKTTPRKSQLVIPPLNKGGIVTREQLVPTFYETPSCIANAVQTAKQPPRFSMHVVFIEGVCEKNRTSTDQTQFSPKVRMNHVFVKKPSPTSQNSPNPPLSRPQTPHSPLRTII